MAAVDFEGFFYSFLSHFLHQMEGLTEDQKIALQENFKPETVSVISHSSLLNFGIKIASWEFFLYSFVVLFYALVLGGFS